MNPFHSTLLSCCGVPLLPPCTTLCPNTHKHTHSVPLCFVSDHVSVYFFTLSSCQLCLDFFFCQSVAQVFTSVMCEFWWNVASRSAGSNMSVESLNQYFLVVFLFLFHPFILFLVFNSVPSKHALPPLYIISPTYCAGTAVSRRYRGCFGQPRLVGYFCPYPRLPRLDSQFSQQRTTQPVYRWKRKKAGRWPQRFLLSAAQGPQWLNSK